MAVTFTCRLLVVRTDTGKIRIKYGYLGDDCMHVFVVLGPRIFLPPEEELTDQEFDRLQSDLVSTGFVIREGQRTPHGVDAPLVEAKKTYEDEIPRGSVETELFWHRNDAGETTLGVRVTNRWNRTVPVFTPAVHYDNETPQPKSAGVQRVGGDISLFHPLEPLSSVVKVSGVHPLHRRDLWPQCSLAFYLDHRAMPELRSYAASLSPERYWIKLRTEGLEFDRIPGDVVGQFLDAEAEAGSCD